ncbi:unnamed protein product (macronuclear) [Paramecium tetraurelia]|uniref:non-specific serine/threonine protein kinase n=1 Tax=Paramecium tetraurelia TaxID=5888 RepID=A0BLY2_PARTE|nr:uncharacterized protein GSPATT00030183001 [Paramecium tetraurelia]CAK59549.1 unnamed protein product [Paramecium tetraurelia]|eukprot:XP_001426947.1 hypothetical protein (macronuclear) [Paramecium tetraurelia strain d4-2]
MGNEPSSTNGKTDFLIHDSRILSGPTLINQMQQNQWRIGLQHPHLLQTLGGQPEGEQYRYYFEICPITLASLLSERYGTKQYFPEEDLQALLLGIVSALSFLQEKGISHGGIDSCLQQDICTQEIFFDSNSSSFKVLDSNLINGRAYAIQEFINGKLKYLAPEIIIHPTQPMSEYQLHKNDIWSLGMVILEAGTLKSNDTLYKNGLQPKLIQDRINEIGTIYGKQFAENIKMMLNFNPNERLDSVNLFNFLLEQQRIANESEQQIQQQQQLLLQQQQQQQQQQLLMKQQQVMYQQQQYYYEQKISHQSPVNRQQQQQSQKNLQQNQYFFQQQKQLQQQFQFNQTQQSSPYRNQIQIQPHISNQQQRTNCHQQQPSQDFMMIQHERTVSIEKMPSRIIKKIIYPDCKVGYQDGSHSASRMGQNQYWQSKHTPQKTQKQSSPLPRQQSSPYQSQFMYQKYNVIGNKENQVPLNTNEQLRWKQDMGQSKLVVQQYNQQKPSINEEPIRRVIVQSQALRDNFV